MEGQKRETKVSYSKQIGIFEGKVIAVNPNKEQLENILGSEIETEPNYLGEKDGVKNARVSVWLQNVWGEGQMYNISFFIQGDKRLNADKTKCQYINSVGQTAWGLIEQKGADLPNWFTHFIDKKGTLGEAKSYRPAYSGEEELVNFVKAWLTYDLYHPDTNILLDVDKLLKGNFKELSQEIDGEYSQNVVAMATVRSSTKEGDDGPVTVNYQSVYNKAFLPGYNFKFFRGVEFTQEKITKIKEKSNKALEPFERFILSVVGEYGCKDAYYIGLLKEFNPADFVGATDKVLESDGADY